MAETELGKIRSLREQVAFCLNEGVENASVTTIVQKENNEWVRRNFGEHPSEHPFLGMVEELGELGDAMLRGIKADDLTEEHFLLMVQAQLGVVAHSLLKMKQKIRGTEQQHLDAMQIAMFRLGEAMQNLRDGLDIEDSGYDESFETMYPDFPGGEFEQKSKIVDAVGDIQVYMADFANQEEIDVESCLVAAWEQVRMRDWNKHRAEGTYIE